MLARTVLKIDLVSSIFLVASRISLFVDTLAKLVPMVLKEKSEVNEKKLLDHLHKGCGKSQFRDLYSRKN